MGSQFQDHDLGHWERHFQVDEILKFTFECHWRLSNKWFSRGNGKTIYFLYVVIFIQSEDT